MKKKILILSEYFPESEKVELKGGAEARAFFIARELAKKYEVTVIAAHLQGQRKKSKFSGIRVLRCGKKRTYTQSGSLLERVSYMQESFGLGKTIDCDIVEGTNFLSYLPAANIAKERKIPSVATYHEVWLGQWIKNVGFFGIFGHMIERIVLKKNWSKFIAVSNFTRNKLIDYVDAKKISVVHNGVSLKDYNVKASKSRRPTIVCIARLVKYKRVNDVINAIKIVKKKIPNICCKIIGSGPLREELEKNALKQGLGDNIRFIGFIKQHKDILKTIKSSQLLVHASVVEGFGIVLVESMASGVPYVCSDIEPFVEVTKNSKGGLIFRRRNVEDLSDKILMLLKNKKLYNTKVNEGKKLSKQYDWKQISSNVEDIYKKLL